MTPCRQKSRYFSSPKHAWSNKHRLLLSLLEVLFANHPNDFARIFNHLNGKTLRREGFKNGIPASSIVAQLHEFRREGTGSRIYSLVSTFSHTELKDLFSAQIRAIQQAAREIEVNLVSKPMLGTEIPRSPPILSFRRRLREATILTETSVTTWQPQFDDNDDGDEAESNNLNTPSRPSKTQPLNTSPRTKYLSPMIPPKSTDANPQKHPYFLYRAYETAHGLKARRFVNTQSEIPIPPRSKSRQFAKEVRPHLDRNQRYNSPFLSFCQNPAVALKHMFARVEEGVPMTLAVVRYDDLKRDSLTRYGADGGPYLVPVICKVHEMFDLPGAYTGTGEFLVWGSVECQSTTTIQAVDALMIRAIMRTISGLDLEAGQRLSRFIPKLGNDQQTELFIYQLVKGYKVKGHQTARKSVGYNDFVRGAMMAITCPEMQTLDVVMIDRDDDMDQDEDSFDTNMSVRATSPDIDVISDIEPDTDTESRTEVDSDDEDIVVLPRRRRIYAIDWRSDTA